jgi:hypothetical protein
MLYYRVARAVLQTGKEAAPLRKFTISFIIKKESECRQHIFVEFVQNNRDVLLAAKKGS